MEVILKDSIVRLIQGDITKIEVDAIVNAANTSLLGGGGVDGAIHKAGGKVILEECMKIRNQQGGCAVGGAVITSGGNLKCRYVIHTVGPVWNGGNYDEEEKLRKCYKNSLLLAESKGVTSIAIPNISTGIYKYPKNLACRIAIDEVANYLLKDGTIINELVFVCFDEENVEIYKNELKKF
ncbi:O-acetyl-ADP-ribose deacetylase [Gorillibacterium massiliense]|uniref:O-acetyl-ADP-ribose deacetylase n=1 Tax=Gorillibacterium massiliense TaxID=1280390 RepID=UPI000594D80D|nr:O-acetyl-ADP-ribose deacetylase [Gorillibacterium massiliense]